MKRYRFLALALGVSLLIMALALSGCFLSKSAPAVSFSIQGTVEDGSTYQPIPNATVYCNFTTLEGTVTKTLQTVTDSSGKFSFKVESSSTATSYELSFIKNGYEVYSTNVSYDDVVKNTVTVNVSLISVRLSTNETLLNAKVNLPQKLKDRITQSVAISSIVPVINGNLTTPVLKKTVTTGALLTNDDRVVGMWISDGSSLEPISSAQTIEAMYISILKLQGIIPKPDGLEQILSYLKKSSTFSQAIQIYNSDCLKENFDIWKDKKLVTILINFAIQNVSSFKYYKASPENELCDYPNVVSYGIELGAWKIKFEFNTLPLYIFAALADGQPLGIINPKKLEMEWLPFPHIVEKPGNTVIETLHRFDPYYHPKLIYLFSGVFRSNDLEDLPNNLPSKTKSLFGVYDILTTLMNWYTSFVDPAMVIAKAFLHLNVPLNTINDLFTNLTIADINSLLNEFPQWESICESFINEENIVSVLTSESSEKFFLGFLSKGASKIDPTFHLTDQDISNFSKSVSVAGDFIDAFLSGGNLGIKLRALVGPDRPEYSWKYEESGYPHINSISFPEKIHSKELVNFSFNGVILSQGTPRCYDAKWDFNGDGSWDVVKEHDANKNYPHFFDATYTYVQPKTYNLKFEFSEVYPTGSIISGTQITITVLPPQTYNVSGYVKDTSGNPVSGVTISFSGGYSSVTTDSNGHWSKDGLSGSVVVTPSKSGWTFTPPSITVTGARSDVNFTGMNSGSGGSWSTVMPMPKARWGLSAVTLNGKIYAMGGYNGGALNTVEVYDPQTDKWTESAPMLTAREVFGAVAYNGKIYVMGGRNGNFLNTMEVYDPSTNKWSKAAPMPTARQEVSAVVYNGKIYAIGGYNGTDLNTVEVYDPSTNEWSEAAPMPIAKRGVSAVVNAGKIYVLGGYNGNFFNTVEVYEPSTNKWSEAAPMPTARNDFAAVAYDGKIYAIGGHGKDYKILNTVEVYNSITDNWSTVAPMPTARWILAAAIYDGKIYAIGGQDNSRRATNKVEVYTIGLQPAPTTYNVSGYVKDTSGNPVSGVTISFSEGYSLVTTDSNGHWAKNGLSGSVVVTPSKSGWTFTPTSTTVTSARDDVNFTGTQSNSISPMPTARSGLAAVTYNGKIYVFGGYDGKEDLSTLEIYNPLTNVWVKGAPMPTARGGLAAVVYNKKIYVIGGANRPGSFLNTLEIYDPLTNTWSKGTPMPTPRDGLAAVTYNGKIYAIGGYNTDQGNLNTVEIYNPETGAWTEGTPLPFANDHLSAVEYNGKIYVIGGSKPGEVFNSVEIYDPQTNTWTKGAPMPTAREELASVEYNGRIYVVGGDNYEALNTLEIYNPQTNTWTKGAPMPTASQALSAVEANGKIYAVGGLNYYDWTFFNKVQVYDPITNTWISSK